MSSCHRLNIMFPFPVTFLILYSCNLPKPLSCIDIVGKLYNAKKHFITAQFSIYKLCYIEFYIVCFSKVIPAFPVISYISWCD